METNREELSRIKEALKRNPKGMNVIEIARAVNMHRQSVTKYVEMLVVSGQVEMKSFGPAKVYYLSQRLPVSSMLSLSSDMILLLDRDLRIINANDALLKFLNATREQILNREMSLVSFPLEFEPSIVPFVSDALQGKESRIDARLPKKGREQFFIVKFIPVVFDDGQPGATVLFENVTEQKKAEREREKLIVGLQSAKEELAAQAKALRDSQSKLEAIFTGMSDAILTIDRDGKIFLLNDACARYYRFGAGEKTYRSLQDIYDTLDVFSLDGTPMPCEEWPSTRAQQGEILREVEVRIRKKETGETWAGSYNSSRILDENGGLLFTVLIARDITARVTARDELADARAQVGLYLDLLDNDIANLHQIALGQLELAREVLADKGLLESEAAELIDTPIDSLVQSNRLIDNVHRLNKLIRSRGPAETMDLDEMLAEVITEHSRGRSGPPSINYVPLAGSLVKANALLKDVFSNLVDYVLGHADSRTKIEVRVTKAGQDGASFYRVTIEDDGPGIPDEKKAEVFQWLETGQPGAKSTVMGQYIARTLVEGFDGRVRIEDRVEGDYAKGSRFVVELPAAEAENGQ